MPVRVMSSLRWQPLPPLSERRVYCSACSDQRGASLLYVLGGCGEGGGASNAAMRLDVSAQRWNALPPMHAARAGAVAVAMEAGQVLVVGGVDHAQTPLATVETYRPDEGKWQVTAALGQAAMGVTAIENDGKVYAFGGMGSDTSPQNHVRLYEPRQDQWLALPPMPTPRYGASAFSCGSKIYVLGGRQGKLPVTALEVLDLEVGGWTRLPSVPTRRAFSGAVLLENCLFSLGGLQQPGPHNFYSRPHFVNTVEEYDLQRGQWLKPSRTSRMREKRADFVCGHLGGRVIVIGGLGNEPSPLSSVESFNPVKRRWEAESPMPTPRCSSTLLQTDAMMFVIGGVSQGPCDAVEALCAQDH